MCKQLSCRVVWPLFLFTVRELTTNNFPGAFEEHSTKTETELFLVSKGIALASFMSFYREMEEWRSMENFLYKMKGRKREEETVTNIILDLYEVKQKASRWTICAFLTTSSGTPLRY
ncbi:uncharacterized protein LOC143223166 isoform X2 [Tachypleus tridentatus]|uniref:uncharacterized protein LOC143223166 isoform X2 n=1 Tax=Tachypleus tridentatus TaxID=6853 RepID=UPI003FD0DD65